MIKKLKRKFIIIATVCMLALMAALLAVMNTVNYRGVVAESDAVLDVLVQPIAPFFDDLPPLDRENARFSVEGPAGKWYRRKWKARRAPPSSDQGGFVPCKFHLYLGTKEQPLLTM